MMNTYENNQTKDVKVKEVITPIKRIRKKSMVQMSIINEESD